MTTIRDVARLAGVSIATVSRVINQEPTVTPTIRQRVLAVVDEIGYHPNAVARSLKRERTYLVGLLMPHIANPFFMEVAKGIEDVIGPQQYSLTLASSDWNPEREFHLLRTFAQQRVDAIVLMTVSSGEARLIHLLQNLDIPYILVDRRPTYLQADTVLPDNVNGVRLLTEHLIRIGHRRIGFVNGPHGITSGTERLEGYRLALEGAGIPYDSSVVFEGQNFTREIGHQLGLELLRPGRVTSVVAGNNTLAIGVLQASRELGLRIPGDLSLVVFGDLDVAELLDPPLTVATNSGYEMGLEAGRILAGRLKSPGAPARPRLVRTVSRLIMRASTAPPSH